MTLALGLTPFTGWAIAVTVEAAPSGPELVDRRRIPLQTPNLPTEVYHLASRMQATSGEALIASCLESCTQLAVESIGVLATEVSGGSFSAFGMVAGKRPPQPPPAQPRLSHTGMHAAEGEFYRHVLIRAGAQLGLPVLAIPATELLQMSTVVLGLTAGQIEARLKEMGAGLGAPWTQRERWAALAGWLALVAEARAAG